MIGAFPVPGRAVPPLDVELLGGETYRLGTASIERLQMVVFYRGRFCVVCRSYVAKLAALRPAFEALGVGVLAASADDVSDAARAAADWGLEGLTVAYGLSVADMRRWGSFASKGDPSLGQPDVFSEPSLYLIKPDHTLFFVTLNSAPGGRPNLDELLEWLGFVLGNPKYPTRGSYLADVQRTSSTQ